MLRKRYPLQASNQTGSFVRMPKIRIPFGEPGRGYLEMSPGPRGQRTKEYLLLVIGVIGNKEPVDQRQVDRLMAEIGYIPEVVHETDDEQEAHEGRERDEDRDGEPATP